MKHTITWTMDNEHGVCRKTAYFKYFICDYVEEQAEKYSLPLFVRTALYSVKLGNLIRNKGLKK